MCGFVVAIGPAGVLPASVVDEMRDRVTHRGPDGARTELRDIGDGRVVAFGHRRLSIIDLSDHAAQPMTRNGLTLVYNGEIYNYVELRAELERTGMTFRSHGDTEVLLGAYELWGSDCLPRLNGMFAFAVWDSRRRELFVGRDRFGEKPLFYARLAGGIVFASEMKALFAHPDVEVAPNDDAVEAYAAGRWYESDDTTFFRGVRRVPAAHGLTIDRSGEITRTWRYWTPDYARGRERLHEPETVHRFRELLERSVALRLRSDVPIGTSLSGGLDSSTIVGMLAGLRKDAPMLSQNTFSGRFDNDPTISEGRMVDLVAEAAGVVAYHTTADPERLVEESARLHWHQEEPFLSASIYLQWCVMRLAHRHATTVLLDGQGADELLGGYQPYFRIHQLDLLDRRRYIRVVRDTRAFAARLDLAAALYENARRRFDPTIAYSLVELARFALKPPPVHAGDFGDGLPPAVPGMRLRRRLAEALQYNSLPLLLRYADRNAMAFGRETRFPYLDYDLVDWCISLPDDALIHDGWQKHILRRAGAGVVPPEVQWRVDKVGYAAPLDVWLRGPLLEWSRERLFSGTITELPPYDGAALRTLWDEHQAGRGEHSWALWRWISLSEWFALLETRTWRHGIDLPSDALARAGDVGLESAQRLG